MNIVRSQMTTLEGLLQKTFTLQFRGRPLVTPYTLGALGLSVIAFGIYKRQIYQKMAEESAAIGKEVMEQNSRNLVETIQKVTKDPETWRRCCSCSWSC